MCEREVRHERVERGGGVGGDGGVVSAVGVEVVMVVSSALLV
jgi:hypothetical protein